MTKIGGHCEERSDVAIRIPERDCYTSDVGHWFAMTLTGCHCEERSDVAIRSPYASAAKKLFGSASSMDFESACICATLIGIVITAPSQSSARAASSAGSFASVRT